MIIRDAWPEDVDQVARIKVASWADSYRGLVPPETLARFLDVDGQRHYLATQLADQNNLLLVADDGDGRIVAFALAFLDEQPDPWLESIHVIREDRGRGTGTMLMRELARRLASNNLNTLRLGVVSGNEGAARLYRRLGAQMIGEEPTDWAPGVTHEIYRWRDLGSLARPV